MTDEATKTTEEVAAVQNEKPGKPSFTFGSLEFKSGLKINLKPNSVVVFVGGNSVGKTQTLRELAKAVEGKDDTKVLLDPHKKLKRENINIESVFALLEKSPNTLRNGNFIKVSLGENLGRWSWTSEQTKQQIEIALRNHVLSDFGVFFYESIKTENRFTDSGDTPYSNARNEPASKPMQVAYNSPHIEEKVSESFQRVFSKFLKIDRKGGGTISFRVGENDQDQAYENKPDDEKDTEYWDFLFKTTTSLTEQGDGMRAFVSVMLGVFANTESKSILLLDEPEAFLHPPQARAVGRILAEDHPQDAQLFIATHSVDVIQGLLDGRKEEDDFHIIRLAASYKGTEAYELNNDIVTFITERAFFRYSKLLSALFYKRVIICEAEADCLFYRLMLSNVLSDPAEVSDILFLSAGGKDKAYQFYGILKSLHIQTDVIVDFDVLNNGGGTFEKTIKMLKDGALDYLEMEVTGGEELWEKSESLWKIVKSNIEGYSKLDTAEEVMKSIKDILDTVGKELGGKAQKTSFPVGKIEDIKNCLKKSSAWEMAKNIGEPLITGKPVDSWTRLKHLCAENHLWIVPVGEMEGFYPSIKSKKVHGNAWLAKLLSRVSDGQINLKTHKELEKARKFMLAIWNHNWEEA